MRQHNQPENMDNIKEEEMRSVTSREKGEEEKWNDFVLEMSLNKVLKKLADDNLNSSWLALRDVIMEKPHSSTTCLEVDIVLKLLVKNCIERNESISLHVYLMKCLAVNYPIEVKFFFPLVCEAMCQTYLALPSSNEYVSRHGQNLCKLLAYLLALPREKDSNVLFEAVLMIVKGYVKLWSCPGQLNIVDELQEYRLCVDATAVTFLVGEIFRVKVPGDMVVQSEVDNFTRWIEKSSYNDTIPEYIRKIYEDGLLSIKSLDNSGSDILFPDFLQCSVNGDARSAPLSSACMVYTSRNKPVSGKQSSKKTVEQSRFVNPLLKDRSEDSDRPSKRIDRQPRTLYQQPQAVHKQPQTQHRQQHQQPPLNEHQRQHRHDALVNMLSLKSSKYDSEEPFRHKNPTKGHQQKSKNNRTHHSTNSISNNYHSEGSVVALANDHHLRTDGFVSNDSEALKRFLSSFACNPREFSMDLTGARCFVLKSNSEDDVFRSIKNSCWTSTKQGNTKLNSVFREQQQKQAPVYLLYSVNGSGHFCGVAEMTSEVDLLVDTGIWVQPKWKGRFDVRWIYVKDIPMNAFSRIRLSNSENKPVSRSRDTQELLLDAAERMLKIIHNYNSDSSIFDDFDHYEEREEEDTMNRAVADVLHH